MNQAFDPQAKWKAGTSEELVFWDGYLATRGQPWGNDFAERMDPQFPLQPFLAELIKQPAGTTVRILDVGAGPLSYVGKIAPPWQIELTAVDPLADAYDEFLGKYGVMPLVRTQRCAAESLTDQFAGDSFDLVTARNAIDHSIDPLLAIRQMVAVAKPGCAVSLHHQMNEAQRQQYLGLHQWNFLADAGDFIISSRAQRINVNQALADCADVQSWTIGEDWINTVITKKPRAV